MEIKKDSGLREPWIMSMFAVYYVVFLKSLVWFHFAEISVAFWAHPDCLELPWEGMGMDTETVSPENHS